MTHLFINANSLYNCWFYTHAAWFVKHDTWYQNWTKIKEHLLNNYCLKYAYCELGTGRNMGFGIDVFHTYIYIWKSVDVHTRYVVKCLREVRRWENISVNVFHNV